MAVTTANLLERIEALFRLGEHETASPNEAANAIGLAQALLLEHNLTRATVLGTPPDGAVGKVEVTSTVGFVWRSRLLHVIAKANLCRTVRDVQTKTSHLFGNRDNVLAVVRMFDWLSLELERQAIKAWKEYKADSGTEASRTWRTAFYDGANDALRARLQPPVIAYKSGSGSAIVLANEARVNAAVSRFFPFTTKGRHTINQDSAGYSDGQHAGKTVRFGPQSAIQGGARALGAGR